MSDTRYIAAWVKRDGSAPGEFDPDAVEYGHAVYPSLDKAQQEAIRLGRQYNVMEWVRVDEEAFNPGLGIPRRSEAAWDTVRTWHGDWDGNWNDDNL